MPKTNLRKMQYILVLIVIASHLSIIYTSGMAEFLDILPDSILSFVGVLFVTILGVKMIECVNSKPMPVKKFIVFGEVVTLLSCIMNIITNNYSDILWILAVGAAFAVSYLYHSKSKSNM